MIFYDLHGPKGLVSRWVFPMVNSRGCVVAMSLV